MNTDKDNNTQNIPSEPQTASDEADISADSLVNVVDTLNSINPETPEAQANETSMDNNNGRRITYTETEEDIKKTDN